MSLNGIIGSALSGLQAAQIGLRTTSNNVSNVNTEGFTRTAIQQVSRSTAGVGTGVEIVGVKRIADIFLQSASRRAMADTSQADVISGFLDRLQAQFGSTDDQGSLFGRLNQAFVSLGAASIDPTESVAKLSALSDMDVFFSEADRLSSEIRSMRDEADKRLLSGVERVNEILVELKELNEEVGRLSASATDTTGAENRQSELVDELSRFLDVRADTQADGQVFIKTQNGVSLLDYGRIELSYNPAGTGAYGVEYEAITATVSSSGAEIDVGMNILSGELRGLMDLRDKELPALASELAEFVSGAADAFNAAHNNASSYAPPNSLDGRQTGLLGSDQLTGSGTSRLALVNSDGTLVQSVELVFGPAGFSVDGNAGTSVTDLVNELNTAFGGAATASFVNGALSITATDPTQGLATLQDEANPSSVGGRGFAHFFGLNDLIDTPRPSFFETGLLGTSDHGLNVGGELGFKVYAEDGRTLGEVSVAVAGTSIDDMIAALNNASTGLGSFGTFALDANGAINFTSAAGYQSANITLTSDTTERGSTGLAFSQIFGIGDAARQVRSESFNVDPDIRANASLLGLAQLDITGASIAGDLVLSEGDNRGGLLLQEAWTTRRGFSAAGGLGQANISLGDYAARFAGDVGARSSRAERSLIAATSVQAAADQKRSDVEGVNLDEELANMTIYQQAYNASARMLQAAKEMTDTLLSIV